MSIVNDEYWDKKFTRISQERFIRYVCKSSNDLKPDDIDKIIFTFLDCYNEFSKNIEIFYDDGVVDYYINGKQKLQATYESLKSILPMQMKNINNNVFKQMLISKLLVNREIMDFVKNIDFHYSKLLC